MNDDAVPRRAKRAHSTRARGERGPRDKLTRERIARLVAVVATGASWEAAARATGVGASTLRRWRADAVAAPAGSLLAELGEALERAEGEAEVALVAIVRAAAPQDWRAAVALLERRWPAQWSQRRQLVSADAAEEQAAVDELVARGPVAIAAELNAWVDRLAGRVDPPTPVAGRNGSGPSR